MTHIGGYRLHVTGYPVIKDYYGACAAECDQFLTGNCSVYRQYSQTCSYDVQPCCKYPVAYTNSRDISNMAQAEVVSRAASDTGSCSDVNRVSTDFRSKLVQGQTSSTSSTPVEIYPWMKETRQNHKRQMLALLPGQMPNQY